MAARLLRHPTLALHISPSHSPLSSRIQSPLSSPKSAPPSSQVPLAIPGDSTFRRFAGLRPSGSPNAAVIASPIGGRVREKGRIGRSVIRAAVVGGRARSSSREREEVMQKGASVVEREYPIARRTKLSSKLSVRVAGIPGERAIRVTISCDMLAALTLHWGVISRGSPNRNWEQPPPAMHPLGSKLVKDYAVESPMLCSAFRAPPGQGNSECSVSIDISEADAPAAINFVLFDEETRCWFNDGARNFHIPLPETSTPHLASPSELTPPETTETSVTSQAPLKGLLSAFSTIFSPQPQSAPPELGPDLSGGVEGDIVPDSPWDGEGRLWLEKDYTIQREAKIQQKVKVRVAHEPSNMGAAAITISTDMPGSVVLHWGVIPQESTQDKWCLPEDKYRPADTRVYKERAVQTPMPARASGGSSGSELTLVLGPELQSMRFVLKDVENNMWYDNEGGDFVVLTSAGQRSAAATQAANLELLERLIALPGHVRKHEEDAEVLRQAHEKEAKAAAVAAEEAGQIAAANAELQTRLKQLEQLAQEQQEEEKKKKHKEESQVQQAQVIDTPKVPKTTAAVAAPSAVAPPREDISPQAAPEMKSTVADPPPGGVSQKQLLKEIDELKAVAFQAAQAGPAATEPAVVAPFSPWRPPQLRPCSGTGSGNEVLLQGFNWESCRQGGNWYEVLGKQAQEIAEMGFTVLWLPPPTESVAPEGYMPRDLYNLNSKYGSVNALKECIGKLHAAGVKVLADAVLNHRCAHYQDNHGIWNKFGGKLAWDNRAIVQDDPHFHGAGNKSSGDNFHGAPNIDHSQDFVRRDLTEWMRWLRTEVGYDGFRLDYVRGFWGGYVKDYLEGTQPDFAVGEYWDSLSYSYGEMDYNQDAHRQRIINWINAAGGNAGAFDVTTKGILHTVLEKCEYWRLKDAQGKPPGVVGWWPSRAVTFIENHDTGSTQGHWRFPKDKELQGYAYILTHPGTPTVFYDHMTGHLRGPIKQLMALRKHAGLHCRSVVRIEKAEKEVYAACIDDKVVVKLGPGHFHPSGNKNWKIAAEGPDYRVWEIAT